MEKKRDKSQDAPLPENAQPLPTTQPPPSTTPTKEPPLAGVGKEHTETEAMYGIPPKGSKDQVAEAVLPEEGYQEVAERATRDQLAADETRMEGIRESGQPYTGPPLDQSSSLAKSRQLELDAQRSSEQDTVHRAREGTSPEDNSHTEITPEGPKPDLSRNPGEKIRRQATDT